MGETKRIIDIKKEKLKEAIARRLTPEKIIRLKEDIKRHEVWELRKRRIIRRKNAIQKKHKRT